MDTRTSLRADRLNCEPPIARGCSYSELTLLVVVSIVVWFPLSFVIAGLVGRLSMGLGIVTLAVLATVYVASGWLQRIKHGRPHGHYQQRCRIILHDTGLWRSNLVRRSGDWDLGRNDRSGRSGGSGRNGRTR